MVDSMLSHLHKRVEIAPNSDAFAAPGYANLDYLTLTKKIEAVVDSLVSMGISSSDPIAFYADKEPATAVLALGLLSHGIAVPLNPDYKQSEIEIFLSRIQVKAVLVPAGQRLTIGKIIENLDITIIEYDVIDWQFNFLPSSRLDLIDEIESVHAFSKDTALILQTSGSTAVPRIVPLTHGNLLAAADNVIRSLSLTETDICLHMLPMFHIGGLVDVLIAPLLSGGQVIFNRGFDAHGFFRLNAEYNPTWTQTVPAMLRELIDVAEQKKLDPGNSRLRFIRSVSAPLAENLYHSAARVFSTSIVEIYGMTEAAGVITSNPVDQERQKTGSVGVCIGPALRIVAEDGSILEAMQAGEVQIKGNSVMQGYYDASQDMNSPALEDGWFKTGDLGYLDKDGALFLTGRLKDIINRGGEKISPSEIDELALEHSMVKDAVCFPVPHSSLSEDIALALVLIPGGTLLENDMREFLKDKLAYFKIPNQIILIDEIPRKNGKLQRHKLADELLSKKNHQDNQSSHDSSHEKGVSKELADLWAKVLEIDSVGMNDDFFYMGGDSLRAIVLLNEMQDKWGVPVIVSSIYDAPVLSDFEQYLKKNYPVLIEKIMENSGV